MSASGSPHFSSILFSAPADAAAQEPPEMADVFHDLNLDRIVADITGFWSEYDLAPFFRLPLHDPAAIAYRQDVMRDLEHADTMQAIKMFSQRMQTLRKRLKLSQDRHYPLEQQRWLLDAASEYCTAVESLHADLARCDLAALGLRALRDELDRYLHTPGFATLNAETKKLVADLSAIRYGLRIRGSSVTVRPGSEDPDYSQVVQATFAKFRPDGKDDESPSRSTASYGLNHVEHRILECVTKLYPQPFQALAAFCAAHTGFLDDGIARFDREVQFYVAYLAHVEKLRAAGLRFCYPQMSAASREIECHGAFDLALAAKLVAEPKPVVCNDFQLRGAERMFVVSGPNQGGKTTFARMFGQLHHLGALGCLVPGTLARLFLCDRVLTHFEREENIANLRGKLQDDLVRMRSLLDRATRDSVVILNESFSSTSLEDALYLSKQILMRMAKLGALGVCVTFLAELAESGQSVVSAVAAVDPQQPEVRTFRIEFRPADGLAYALTLARKYRLTQDNVMERIKP